MTARTSSSSEIEEITTGVVGTSGNIQQTRSYHREKSPTASQRSAVATGTPYDTVSIATTANTGFTNMTVNTSASQQYITESGIPIIRPPVLQQQQQQLSGTNIGVVNQPIKIDVASAHQQYQQQTAQSEISPYSSSSTTSSGGALSSSGNATLQQWPQSGYQTSGQFQYQQAQFANQLPGQQSFNELLGANAFQDVSLNIDYGVIEAYNIGIQSAGDITAGLPSGGVDGAKPIFKQVDTNQEAYQQWGQGASQNVSGQPYSNYQAATTTNYGNNFNHGQLYSGANPDIANILQQSGLAQGYANYR